MANTVEKVLKIAESEVGYLEKKTNADLDSKTKNAGYNNYTKYGRDMHKIYPEVMDFPAPWCDCFVDWCFYKAYKKANAKKLLCGDFNDYTVISAQLYKNKNAWYKSPKIGDQIFFANSKGGICHTGLVYKVDTLYVYTIEGNTSGTSGVVANGGGVFKKKYAKTNSRIAGYGRPKYDTASSSTTSTKTTTTSKPKKPSNIAQPMLRNGSKGTQVKYLQQDLNFILGTKLKVDGIFGGATANALKQFQKKYGLEVDGVYGKASFAQMTSLIGKAV